MNQCRSAGLYHPAILAANGNGVAPENGMTYDELGASTRLSSNSSAFFYWSTTSNLFLDRRQEINQPDANCNFE